VESKKRTASNYWKCLSPRIIFYLVFPLQLIHVFPTRSQPTRTGKHLKELMCKGSLYMVDSNNHLFSDVTLVPLIQSACKMFAKRWLDSRYVSNVCLLTLVQNIWLAEVKKTVHDILSFQSLVLGTCPLTIWWIGATCHPCGLFFFGATGTDRKEWRFTHRIMGSCLADFRILGG